MTKKQAATRVFLHINEELSKIEDNNLRVKRLKLLNEELCEAVLELINKYECKSIMNSATSVSNYSRSISERPSVGTLI
jgi:hypothetical protein